LGNFLGPTQSPAKVFIKARPRMAGLKTKIYVISEKKCPGEALQAYLCAAGLGHGGKVCKKA